MVACGIDLAAVSTLPVCRRRSRASTDVAVLGHAGEVVALGLAGAEGLAFHGFVRDLAAPGQHGGAEVGEDFLAPRAWSSCALFVGERDARRPMLLNLPEAKTSILSPAARRPRRCRGRA